MSGDTTDTGEHRGEPIAESGSGLDSNVAGALSYLLGLVTGLIFYFVDSDDEFVRWHAAQSIAFSLAVIVVSFVLSILSSILFGILFAGSLAGGGFGAFALLSSLFSLVWGIISLVILAAWLYLMFTAYKGQTKRLPVIAGFADRIAAA